MGVIDPNFVASPYWWDAAPPTTGNREAPEGEYDVVIVGSGVTGLSAALTLAQAGRKVVVCDSETIGFGASTRNSGSLLPFLFLHQEALEAKFGAATGTDIAKLAVDAYQYAMTLPDRYGFDPMLRTYDRYFLAWTEKHRRHLAESAVLQSKRGIGLTWTALSAAELQERTGLKGYYGGVYVPNSTTMHPGLFVKGIRDACNAAGVATVSHCRVSKIARQTRGFTIHTAKGAIRSRDVISATNGYTSNENPALRKRLLSVRLYMAVTQPMPAEIRGKLFPTPRQFVDSKISMNWIRPSQDGGRLLIGGRGGMLGNDPVKHAQILHADMVKMIPELAPLKITHSWHGLIDFSHDFAPHIGQMDGIYYAAGYCGVGMALGTYLGTKLANKILGARGELAATAIDSLKFPKEPMLGPFRDLYAQLGSKYMELRDWWDLRER